jgi:hypothetical protein
MSDSKYADLDPYLRHITPMQTDPTYSILKAHLLFEEMLRDYLNRALPNPSALESARLSFAQLLAVVRALSKNVPVDHWHWKAISELNKLRNTLAHNLEPAALGEKIEKYVEYVVRESGNPLPPPSALLRSGEARSVGGPLYLDVDMVTAGLFMYTAASLGLIPEHVLKSLDRGVEGAS